MSERMSEAIPPTRKSWDVRLLKNALQNYRKKSKIKRTNKQIQKKVPYDAS